jgi:hypothetical protein
MGHLGYQYRLPSIPAIGVVSLIDMDGWEAAALPDFMPGMAIGMPVIMPPATRR